MPPPEAFVTPPGPASHFDPGHTPEKKKVLPALSDWIEGLCTSKKNAPRSPIVMLKKFHIDTFGVCMCLWNRGNRARVRDGVSCLLLLSLSLFLLSLFLLLLLSIYIRHREFSIVKLPRTIEVEGIESPFGQRRDKRQFEGAKKFFYTEGTTIVLICLVNSRYILLNRYGVRHKRLKMQMYSSYLFCDRVVGGKRKKRLC